MSTQSYLKTSSAMKMITSIGASCIVMAFSAQAKLTLTNGSFDAATTADNPDVPDWFDGNNHPQGYWQDIWLASRSLPSGQSGGTAGLSGAVDGGQNFLYQSIGTRNPVDSTLYFSASVGAFTDANSAGTMSGTLMVGIYEQTSSFSGADGTDVDGASGISQVGSTVALPISREGGPGAVASDETGSFDISGVDASHTLYLRFKWVSTGASFMSLENASITTRPPLAITNGGFNAASDSADVPDWFDGNNHTGGYFYRDTWLNLANPPSGQNGGTVGFSGVAGAQNFLYQDIGVRHSGDSALNFTISVGAFADVGGTKTGTLTVGLYEQTGSFAGADGTDVDGASGITRVGSSVALPISRESGPGAVASDETGAFDISATSLSNTLYLRYQWIPSSSADFITLDNASITVSQGGTPYDTWANGPFSPALIAKLPADNQDGDSLNNLQEYAFGTQPTVSTGEILVSGASVTPGAPKMVADNGNFYMVFGRRADYVAAGLTYTVQFSTALETWVNNNDTTNPPVQVATDGTIQAMSVPYPLSIVTPSGPREPKFARVQVVLAP